MGQLLGCDTRHLREVSELLSDSGSFAHYSNLCNLRYSRGVQPKDSRNASLKRLSEPKPELNAMLAIESVVVTSSRCACDSRY